MIRERGFASLHIPGNLEFQATWSSRPLLEFQASPGNQRNDNPLRGLGYFTFFLLSESSKGCQTLDTCEEHQPAYAPDADPVKKKRTSR
jgi:hypothetical protein